jgi:hypothetical protein
MSEKKKRDVVWWVKNGINADGMKEGAFDMERTEGVQKIRFFSDHRMTG